MNEFSLSHLSDKVLLSNLSSLVVQGREHTAALLAHLAELEARKLYVPAGYPSLYDYCVRKMRFSEDEALARIRVARKARLHPSLFASIADGRVSLSAALLLAPNLTSANASDLLEAATHKSCKQIHLILAERFPQGPVATRLEPIPASPVGSGAQLGTLDMAHPASADNPIACEHELSLGTNQLPRKSQGPGFGLYRLGTMRSSARSAGRRMKSCCTRRPCFATRIPLEIPPKCWTGRWMR